MSEITEVEQSAARQIAKLLHSVSSRHRMLAMLTAYMDESGIHEGSNICAIAGFMGTEEEWSILERRWKTVIRNAGISAFHMAEFESRHGEFQGWSELRRKSLLRELVETIKARDLHGVGSALVVADYNLLSEGDRKYITHNNPDRPYFLCFQHCIVESAHHADNLPPEEKVGFVFDRQHDFAAEAKRLYNDMKDQIEWENRHRLADALAFASKRGTVQLQAADLAAYECYKHLDNKLCHPERAMRWPMNQIRRRFRAKYFDSSAFEALLAIKPK